MNKHTTQLVAKVRAKIAAVKPNERPLALSIFGDVVHEVIQDHIASDDLREADMDLWMAIKADMRRKCPQSATPSASAPADNPEAKALTYFRKKFWDHVNPGQVVSLDIVAKTVLRTALAHPKELASWIGAAADYREAEGFSSHETVELSLIAGRKEYRRVKVSQ